MHIRKVGVSCRRLVSPVTEKLVDQGQVFTRRDSLTGCRVPKLIQPQSPKPSIGANRPPTPHQAVLGTTLSVSRKHVCVALSFSR